MRKSSLFITNMILAIILLLTGCAGTKKEEPIAEAEQGIHYSIKETELPNPMEEINLKEGEHCSSYNIMMAGDTVVCQDRGYGGDYEYWFFYTQIFNRSTGEWKNYKIGDTAFELDGVQYGGFGSMVYPSDEGFYTVAGKDEQNVLCCLTQDGVSKVVCDYPEEIWEIRGETSYYLDRDGRLYIYIGEEKNIRCYSASLQFEKMIPVPDQVYGILQKNAGEDVYWYGVGTDKYPVIANLTTGKTLVENIKEVGTDYRACFAPDGSIYLADAQNLWNFKDGELTKVYPFVKQDYLITNLYDIECDRQGEVRLLVEMDRELVVLEMKEVDFLPEKQEIIFADSFQDSIMLKRIARFNRQSEQYHVSYLTPGPDEDVVEFRERIQLEISNGKGPDLLTNYFISHPEGLVEKGYLAEMEDVISDSSLYMQGALDNGRINGVLYAFPYDCSFDFVSYDKDVLGDRTSISLQEFMEMVEESDAQVVQKNLNGVDFIIKYVLYDDENPDYIDWVSGKSYLADPKFIRILEFAKKYADDDNMDKKAFAYKNDYSFNQLGDIKEIYNFFDGNAVLLGYPCKEGNGIYVNTGLIYLNANSGSMEGAREFLGFLVSEREQKRYFSYCFEIEDGSIVDSGIIPFYSIMRNAYAGIIKDTIEQDADSVKYLGEIPFNEDMVDQFYFILDHAKAGDSKVNQISGMIEEELAPYFGGDITAAQAAENLQSRVQLYLNER